MGNQCGFNVARFNAIASNCELTISTADHLPASIIKLYRLITAAVPNAFSQSVNLNKLFSGELGVV